MSLIPKQSPSDRLTQLIMDADKDAFGDDIHKPVPLPAMTIRRAPSDIGTTEPEEAAILALREWTRAQANPYLRAYLMAWDDLRYTVDNMDGGRKEAELTSGFTKKERKALRRVQVMIYREARRLYDRDEAGREQSEGGKH